MDIDRELSRLLPRLDQVPTGAQAQEFLKFLLGLDRKDYEEVLRLLPGRLTHHREAVPRDEAAWEKFVDFACYQAILNYTRHRPGSEIVKLLSSSSGLGASLGQLVQLLSAASQQRIVNDLLAVEARQCEAFLEELCKLDRPGMVDYILEAMLQDYLKERGQKAVEIYAGRRNPADTGLSPRRAQDERLVQMIQARRRQDPKRLPAKISSSYEARFIAEEISRELFGYPRPDEAKAVALITRLESWYEGSQLRQSILKNIAIYLIESGFFSNLVDVQRKIALGASYEGHWKTYIQGSLRSEKFWQDIAGLNHDIPPLASEAGQRRLVYQRAAVIGGLIFAGLLLLPVTIRLVVAAPGAVVRLVRWTGSRLLLASQYAYTTYKAFGFFAGTAQMLREGYTFYLQNALVINQGILDMTEFYVDFSTDGTGLAPGSSPADLARHTLERITLLTGKKGLAKLAAEARVAVKQADTDVELVQLVVEAKDKRLYAVVAKVTDFKDGKIKLEKLRAVEVTGKVDEQAQKTITFFGKAQKEAELAPDPRAIRDKGVAALQGGADPKALDQGMQAARAEATAAAAGKTGDKDIVDLAARRAQKLEQERLAAEKVKENLAQRQALQQAGERKVANAPAAAPDTGAIELARKGSKQGGSDGAVLGRATPAQGGGSGNPRNRSTAGGGGSLKDDARALNDRAKSSHLKSVPADLPAGKKLTPIQNQRLSGILNDIREAGLDLDDIGIRGGNIEDFMARYENSDKALDGLRDLANSAMVDIKFRGMAGKTLDPGREYPRGQGISLRPKQVTETKASHDIGVEGGRAAAQRQGIKIEPWNNPRSHIGLFGKGLDDVGQAPGGLLVILEWKGGPGARLSSGQMTSEWVGRKIAELEYLNDDMAARLLNAAQKGSLSGKTYKTILEDGQLRTTLQDMVFDYQRVYQAYQTRLAQLKETTPIL